MELMWESWIWMKRPKGFEKRGRRAQGLMIERIFLEFYVLDLAIEF